jgi:hypothetical protein
MPLALALECPSGAYNHMDRAVKIEIVAKSSSRIFDVTGCFHWEGDNKQNANIQRW